MPNNFPILPNDKNVIGIIGGGQLGKMIALSASKAGYKTHVYCPKGDNPAVSVVDKITYGQWDDYNKLIEIYENTLAQAIQRPVLVLFLTLLTFTSVILLYSKFNGGVIFFPNDKATTARVEVMARGNLSPNETGNYIKEVSEVIDANPYVKNYVANTMNRNRIWLFDDSPTDIIGRIWLELLPPDQRPDSDIVLPNIQKELNNENKSKKA